MQYGIIWNYTETKNMKTRQNMFSHLKNLEYKRRTIKPLIVSAGDSVQESFFCLLRAHGPLLHIYQPTTVQTLFPLWYFRFFKVTLFLVC